MLALSPYTHPFVAHLTLGALKTSVSTWDFGITPALRKAGGVYEQTPAPKNFVEYGVIGHLGWTDLRSSAHQMIIAYSLAFLDHYVKGLPASPLLTQAQPGVAAWRYDSELGSSSPAAGQDSERPSRGQRLRQRLGSNQ